MSNICIRRVYNEPSPSDGLRVLVDRLWPRGLKKENAHVDHWLKDIAPSDQLRKWFGHDPSKWTEFQKRYQAELDINSATDILARLVSDNDVVSLLYAAKDEQHNHALVLKNFLMHMRRRSDFKKKPASD